MLESKPQQDTKCKGHHIGRQALRTDANLGPLTCEVGIVGKLVATTADVIVKHPSAQSDVGESQMNQ